MMLLSFCFRMVLLVGAAIVRRFVLPALLLCVFGSPRAPKGELINCSWICSDKLFVFWESVLPQASACWMRFVIVALPGLFLLICGEMFRC